LKVQRAGEFEGGGNLRRRGAARLFCRLPGDALPTLDALPRGRSQVCIGAVGDERDNPTDAELGRLLDGPFHAIKLEDGEKQGDFNPGWGWNFLGELKLDTVWRHRFDSAAANGLAGGDVEVFSDASSKYTDQVVGVLSDKSGPISGDFVGNPAAACHVR
jgi:hypothetical protein